MKILFSETHNLDRPDPVGSHHYIKLFQKAGHKCIWLGPPISPFHVFKPDQANRNRFSVWRHGIKQVDGISWFIPLTLLFYYNLPLLRSLYIGRNQFRFAIPPLRAKFESLDIEEGIDLLWCAGPASYSLLDIIPYQVSCYRLADRLDQFSRIPANIVELQKDLISRVNLVLATSRELFEWARGFRKDNIYYIPNGVSNIFFRDEKPLPEDFPADERPVAVYAGTLDWRFNIDFFKYAVHKLKHIHFLLIGPVTHPALSKQLIELDKEDNLTRLGFRNYNQLPNYLHWSSIGLIPFYKTKLTEAVNPIKYFEYLACGLPVVASAIRELVEMDGPVYVYKNKEEFISCIDKALENSKPERKSNILYAAGHRWENRFDRILDIIEENGLRAR